MEYWFMMFKNMIYLCALFVLLPALIGVIWVKYLKIQGKIESFCNAWILGLITMLCAGQLVLVPAILFERTLTEAVIIWKVLLAIPAVVSCFLLLPDIFGVSAAEKAESEPPKKKPVSWIVIFGILAAILIFIQAFIPMKYQHIDDDDSRFVAEQVSAVVHDTLLKDDPITVDFMYWDVGEVRKDISSPWPMYVAMCCRIAGIEAAIFSHTYFPFFMIIICYVVYGMIGRILFRGDMEKTFLFLIFLSVFHIWDYTSTHTLASMFLLRIWQGKAIVAGFIIPLLLYLFYRIYEQREDGNRWITVLYIVGFASSLLSGMGIIIAPILVALYGALDFLYRRDIKRVLAIWSTAIPCAIYMGYYLI